MNSTNEIIDPNSGLIPDLQNINSKDIENNSRKINIHPNFLSTEPKINIHPNFLSTETKINIHPNFLSTEPKTNFDDFIKEEFDINSNFTSFSDIMEIIYNKIEKKKFDEGTKKTLNNFFKTYENNYVGFKTAQHYLGFDKTIISGVIYFVKFVDKCKKSLNYFLDYNDQDDDDQSIKNMFYCYLHGIIFTWFYLTFTNTINSDSLSKSLVNPELVSFFKCCKKHLYPAHAGYLDAVCLTCNKRFELKSVGHQLDEISDIINHEIPGGTVHENRFKELQDGSIRPDLLINILLSNEKYKKMIKISPNKFSILKGNENKKKNNYVPTIIKVNNIDNYIEQKADYEIEILENKKKLNDDIIKHINIIIEKLKETLSSRLKNIKIKLNDTYSSKNMHNFEKNLEKMNNQIEDFEKYKKKLKISDIRNFILNCMTNYKQKKKGLLELPYSNMVEENNIETNNYDTKKLNKSKTEDSRPIKSGKLKRLKPIKKNKLNSNNMIKSDKLFRRLKPIKKNKLNSNNMIIENDINDSSNNINV